MTNIYSFCPHLKNYHDQIEQHLIQTLASFGEKTPLVDACSYALRNGGKRLRPIIVLMVADSLGKGYPVYDAALATEFFHTSSLIADDLPCMDNDDMRRGVLATHKKFNEDIALLATYALIAEGYQCIINNIKTIKHNFSSFDHIEQAGLLAIENVSRNTGLLGISSGQLHDLYPPKVQTPLAVESLIQQKTISLFDVSFVLGWLFGGGNLNQLSDIQALAFNFGMAFQIADDFEDVEQDKKQPHSSNFVLVFGAEAALERFQKALVSFKEIIKTLGLKEDLFNGILDFIHMRTVTYYETYTHV